MGKDQTEFEPQNEELAVLAADLRCWIFKEAIDAARYFKLTPGTISRYENGKTIPPFGYLACLTRLMDERFEQAGQLDSNRKDKLLKKMRAAILNYYPEEKFLLDWDELLRVSDEYMKSRWGDNWLLELAHVLQRPPLGNLPTRHEEHLGYEQEVKNILEFLTSDYQLVVIEGIDGVGKTWLAIEVGNQCFSRPTKLFEAVIWVSAKDHPEQKHWFEAILNIIARQLRYPHLVQLPLEERRIRLNELLHRHHTLLIIDNFNTIEDPDLEDWLRHLPEKSKVLITSRYTHSALSSARTQSVRLGGLTTPNTLSLIRLRARQIGLQKLASVPDETLLPLAEAAAGNPLIINGAVGYFKYTGDFEQAVEYTIQKKIWEPKWEILTLDARQVLSIAPFFAESMSSEALGTVAGIKGNQLYEALEQLEKIQLLEIYESQFQQGVQIRYSIHPTVRSFATSKLKAQPIVEEQVREQWITYYINFAKRYLVQGDMQDHYWNAPADIGLAPIDSEWSNLKTVLRWLAEHGRDEALVALMTMLIHYLHKRGFYAERIEYAEKAARAAQRLGQNVLEAYFRIDGLGWILINEHRFEEALEQINRGLDLAQSQGTTYHNATNLITLAHAFRAQAYLEQGYIEKASEELDKVLSNDSSLIIRSKVGMVAGDIALKEKKYPQAIQSYKEAIEAIHQIGIGYEGSSLYYRLGSAYLAGGDIVRAESAFSQMLTVYAQEFLDSVVFAEYGLARVAEQRGEISRATALAQQAYTQLSEMNSDHWLLREIEKFLDNHFS